LDSCGPSTPALPVPFLLEGGRARTPQEDRPRPQVGRFSPPPSSDLRSSGRVAPDGGTAAGPPGRCGERGGLLRAGHAGSSRGPPATENRIHVGESRAYPPTSV